MDCSRDGIPPLNSAVEDSLAVDLHLHSTASDGALPPEEVVARAAALGLGAMALTDHDTLAGIAPALEAGAREGIRVIAGCEFSVQAQWGEMHLLGYFLPLHSVPLQDFLVRCRTDRERRGGEMVERLRALGISIAVDDVLLEAQGGSVGRPHVARALLRLKAVNSVQDAFDRFLGWGRPAFVHKRLPPFREVAELVHACGGVVSAAHLKDRGTRAVLAALMAEGLDAVETRHPTHHAELRARLTEHAHALGLLRTGGSDWHGETVGLPPAAEIGGQEVPMEWLSALEEARPVGREPPVASTT
jgi:predicted metal-dependent phosphoesterase TrpH